MTPAKMFDGDLYVLAADAVQMAENAYKNGQTDEREACAQTVEGFYGSREEYAAAIRARGQHGNG